MSEEALHVAALDAAPEAASSETEAPSPPARIEALHAGPVGAAAAGLVTAACLGAAGLAADRLTPAYGVAIVLLALVVQQDTRHRKIPNWLTGAGLLAAVALHGVQAGPATAGMALLHALVPFAILILPFAAGMIGAGDVKAFMVLAALFGPATSLALIVYAAVIGGVVATLWLWSQGELWLLFERAFKRLRGGLRRQGEPESLPEGRAIGSALPMGTAIAAALAVRVLLERYVS